MGAVADIEPAFLEEAAQKALVSMDYRSGENRVIADDAANLRSHFPERYFDFVLMNGVFGGV